MALTLFFLQTSLNTDPELKLATLFKRHAMIMSIREYIIRLKHQKDFNSYMWLLIALPSESFSLTRRNENGSNVHKTGHPIDYHKERLRDRRKFGT
jgi:hypothetical protein